MSFLSPVSDPTAVSPASPAFAGFLLPDDGGRAMLPTSINCRYAGVPVDFVQLVAAGPPVALRWPASGSIRNVTIAPHTDPRAPTVIRQPASELPAGVGRIIELSPFLFGFGADNRALVARLPGGVPTFYIGLPAGTTLIPPTLANDDLVMQGSPIASVATFALGVVFQDRVSVSARTWMRLLADAVGGTWADLLARLPATRELRVLDHVGRPVAGASFATSDAPGAALRVSDARGAIALDPGPLRIARRESPAGGENLGRIYSAYATAADGGTTARTTAPRAIATVARDDGASSATPALLLPATYPGGELQMLSLLDWLGATPRSSNRRRWYTASKVEPLIDGVPTFGRIAADLRLAAAAPESASARFGLHLLGWDLHVDFPLIEGEPDTTLLALIGALRNSGADVCAIMAKIVNVRDQTLVEEVLPFLVLLLLLAVDASLVLSIITPDWLGYPTSVQIALAVGSVGAGFLLGFASRLGLTTRFLTEFVELSASAKTALAALPATASLPAPPLFLHAPYPARLADNPLNVRVEHDSVGLVTGRYQLAVPGLAGGVLPGIMDQFGTWHQKAQLFRLPRAGGGARYVAYIGGLDFNPNRMETPGHHGRSVHFTDPMPPLLGTPWRVDRQLDVMTVDPFHDVHARVTGPAIADAFNWFQERFDRDRRALPTAAAAAAATPVFPPPAASELELGAGEGEHAVKIGMTYLRARPVPIVDAPRSSTYNPAREPDPATDPYLLAMPGNAGSTDGEGETTIYETLLAAIDNAREYIYIEDQYFTPNDSPLPAVRTYMSALLAAARSCQRLVILLPAAPDQPFGSERRTYLFQQIRTAWGARAAIGTPMRRPFLPGAGKLSSQGRLSLVNGVDADATRIVVGPASRLNPVPPRPFWLWIDGELLRVIDADPPTASNPTVALTVERGGVWGATPRRHGAAAAVTLSQPAGIYVHAKIMMVDDVFVSIGSANTNRRGLFHDGEMNCFAIPERLKSARDNPARAARTALWAEHLGLAPEMGASLLADPIAAFEHFQRTRFEGNRFVHVSTLPIEPAISAESLTSLMFAGFRAGNMTGMWDFFSDPTGWSDPAPAPGPATRR